MLHISIWKNYKISMPKSSRTNPRDRTSSTMFPRPPFIPLIFTKTTVNSSRGTLISRKRKRALMTLISVPLLLKGGIGLKEHEDILLPPIGSTENGSYLFVCGSLACWSRLDYVLLVLAWMLLYANFQFKVFKSQMMVTLRYCHHLN